MVFRSEFLNAQIKFQKCFSYTNDNFFSSAVQVRDSGYVAAGVTSEDMWVVKTDPYGNPQWTKSYGGQFLDIASSIEQTNDGGYIVSGFTESFAADFYVVKIDSTGGYQWSKTFGDVYPDKSYEIHQTTDSGYILTGTLNENSTIGANISLVKLDINGTMQWEKTFGNPIREDHANEVKQTTDGGYIIAGYTNLNGTSGKDIFIIKTDSIGNLEWTKVFYGPSDENAVSILQKYDQGYLIGGYTSSNTTPVGNTQAFIISTDDSGNVQWAKTYGGPDTDQVYSIDKTSDSGFVATGPTTGFGANVRLSFAFKINGNGTQLWAKTYGNSNFVYTSFNSVRNTFDNGFIFSGYRDSSALHRAFLVKTDPNGNSGCVNSNIGLSTQSWTYLVTTMDSAGNGIQSTQPSTITSTPNLYQLILCVNVGIEENQVNKTCRLFPNPAQSEINIDLPSDKLFEWEVLNILGEKLTLEIHQSVINISGLSNGIYFLKIKQGNKNYYQKFIKQF